MNKDIPMGWRIVNFGDVVSKVSDRFPNRDEWTFDKFVSGNHIDSGQIRVTKYDLIKGNEETIGSAFHMRFQPGHVLYGSRRAYLRKGGIVNFEGICSNTTFVLQADESQLLQSLLPFIIQTEAFVKHATDSSHGSTNPFLNWKDIASYELLLPPILEQKKISEILWAIETNIAKNEKLIAKTEKAKDDFISELLTKGIKENEKEGADVGDIPDRWKLYAFTDAINVNPKRKLKKGQETSFVAMQDVLENHAKIQSCSRRKYKSGGSKFENGDTLLARITPCLENGKTAYVDILDDDEIGFGSTEFIVLSSKKDITLNKYVYYLTISPFFREKAINSMVGTTGRQRVPNDFFDSINISIPPIDEQKEIVNIFEILDINIAKYKNHLKYTSKLKQKISNDLLSGNLKIPQEALQNVQ